MPVFHLHVDGFPQIAWTAADKDEAVALAAAIRNGLDDGEFAFVTANPADLRFIWTMDEGDPAVAVPVPLATLALIVEAGRTLAAHMRA